MIVDTKDYDKFSSIFKKHIQKTMAITMMKSFQLVGLTATRDYMVRAHVIDKKSGYNVGTVGSKLNIRSGRLARSLVGQFDFSGGSGGTNESIRRIAQKGFITDGTFGSKVPYAAIHEYGGVITGNPFLRFKIGPFLYQKRSVKIPARPYLRPALKKAYPEIRVMHNAAISGLIKKAEAF